MKNTAARTGRLVAVTAAATLALSACSGSAAGDDGGDGGDGDTITLGIIPSWADGAALAYFWQVVLEDEGYTVDIEEMSEAAPLFTAVANGDYDVYPSAWPEVTHAQYMEEYGDELEDLGSYYENGKLTVAVPEYTDIDSIAELNENADRFDGKIYGIEPGAGMTQVAQEELFPQYELGENFELVTSSTPAMLSELDDAVSNEEDIVVQLWRPYWANSEFPVKDLEDPKGAMGPTEGLNAVAREGFSEDQPEVAEWMGELTLDDEQLGTLEDLVFNDYEDDPAAGAEAWVEDHSEFVEELTAE